MLGLKTFGKNPEGKELEKIKQSPQYRDGMFHNLTETAIMLENASFLPMLWRFMNKPADTKPSKKIPSVITDLKSLDTDKAVIVWFGHSSYLIHINQKNILVDPVFCGHASPFSFTAKSFEGTDVYSVEDLPPIDILILTHDHYDHLDYETVTKLKSKCGRICTSFGVASHLVYWGIDENIITEFDWWQRKKMTDDIELTATPARHFSGRTFTRGKTLWSSFVLRTSQHCIYIGGDSGYETHFKTIGEQYGPMDIAILECGQYNEQWPNIHMMPEQTVQAALDLQAKMVLPVHWGKFSLSLHPWDEPIHRIVSKAKELNVKLTTPKIGEPIIFDEEYPQESWWE
jgi:L-ascorbate metabolism protein UlaG (beta-lactamase superfamily)